MADDKQSNDEYQIPDMEGYQEDSYEQPRYDTATADGAGASLRDNPVLKKAGIVILIIIIAMIGYKFWGSIFSGGDQQAKSSIPDLTKAKTVPKQAVAPEKAAPVQPPPQPVPAIVSTPGQEPSAISKKVASLEISQQSIRDDISNITGQMGTVNGNVGELSDKISEINQNIQILMGKLDKQASELHRLRMAQQAKKKPPRKKIVIPKVTWNVQAVVPGRAWLIASNGSTLTVRKGSLVPGLGTVRMIDTEQGKVILRSGRVIGFSPHDS